MKQFIVNRHTTPATPTLDEVPNEKIRVFKNEATIDAALSSLDENEIVATEDGAESSTRIGNPLGTILAIHSNAVPYGYLPCNGVAFDEHQYPALYALLGDNHTPVEGHTLDWDNAESITLSTSDYVVQKNGWLVGFGVGQSRGDILINGVVVARYDNTSTYNYTADIQIKVKKGDVIKITYNILSADQNFHLVPYKYYKVIKATSGLEETQQDYVLQSLLEADSYSTEEVATGKKWIDGKTIYRKVFYSATNWANGTTIGTISNISMVTEIRDITRATNNFYYENLGIVGSDSQKTNVRATDGAVIVDRSGIFSNSLPSTVIVEYTKTN